jgi:hypothetical protein
LSSARRGRRKVRKEQAHEEEAKRRRINSCRDEAREEGGCRYAFAL